MSMALVTPAPAGVAAQTEADWREIERVFRGMVGRNIGDTEIDAALLVCRALGFNPILNHIFLIKGQVYVSHKGLLNLAHRTPAFDGIEVLAEDETQTHWTARVAVYRKDMRPFVYTGRYPKTGDKRQYGPEMAVTRAETMALRRAFDVSLPIFEDINWEEQGGERSRPRAEIREVPRPAPVALPSGEPARDAATEPERARAHALKQFGPLPATLPELEAQLAPLAKQVRTNDEALSNGEYQRYHDLEARRKELLAAPPALDFAAWSASLDQQAADGVALRAIAEEVGRVWDRLTDDQAQAVTLRLEQIKAARKAGKAAPDAVEAASPTKPRHTRPAAMKDEALLAIVVNAGGGEEARATAARTFLARSADAEGLFARVAQLTVLAFPQPILDVLVAEQRERLGLPDDEDAGEVIETVASPPDTDADDYGDVPF